MGRSRFGHTDSINDIISKGKQKGIWQLYNESPQGQGRTIEIDNKELINFGSCSYLGLDFDPRLIEATIEGVTKFGTQVSSSRTYLSSGLYKELEFLISSIFHRPVVISATTTLGHLSSIPVLVGQDDAVILDQSVHASIQQAVQTVKSRGISVDIVRHNNLEQLEDKLRTLRQKHDVIWYMADGIYSMYGEECPINELYHLMDKYPQLHLYIDDAHGLSWAGKNGAGFIASKVHLHERMILTGSLHKAFGSVGGVIVCPDNEMADRIRNCGNTLVFSGPINPPMLSASIASAKIHLSDEIYHLQDELKELITFANGQANKQDLPLPYENHSPITFIGVGRVNIGYNLTQHLIKEGFYTNLAVFPAVPMKNTGIRICSTLHHNKSDYTKLMAAIAHHLPAAIDEDNWSRNKIQRAFSLPNLNVIEQAAKPKVISKKKSAKLDYVLSKSIREIPKFVWNQLFPDAFHSWDGMKFLEEVFTGNHDKENNWSFFYYVVYDKDDNIVLATVLTKAVWKDDMLAHKDISSNIELQRIQNKYFLTTDVLAMGTLMSEGNHLFVNKKHSLADEAIKGLLEKLRDLQESENAGSLVLRDFKIDTGLRPLFLDMGFVGMNMPDNHSIDGIMEQTVNEYIKNLSKNSRKHFKRNILPYEKFYDVQIITEVPDKQTIDHWYQLYLNVKNKNLSLNTFELPKKLFKQAAKNLNLWDIIELKLKPEFEPRATQAVAVLFSYKSKQSYSPHIIGIDYEFNGEYQCYRQAHYQAIQRTVELGFQNIKLGYMASIEKQRLGAKIIPTVIFAENADNFGVEAINVL